MKKLIVFDLDGTLAESKQTLSKEMGQALLDLMKQKTVAIMSGCNWSQFSNQVLETIDGLQPVETEETYKLLLLPTCGASMYKYFHREGWKSLYNNALTMREKYKIYYEWNLACCAVGVKTLPGEWGELAEDRGSQITFSMLGQSAPLEAKRQFDPDGSIRQKIINNMVLWRDFDVRMGGTTSIDVTRKGINKAYGIEKLKSYLDIKNEDILFIGDALQPGGNDYAVKEMGIDCIEVSSPEETLEKIKEIQ